MQIYNVEKNDAKWAKTKADLMIPARRQALMRELISRNQQGALRITGELNAEEHGKAVARRIAQNG